MPNSSYFSKGRTKLLKGPQLEGVTATFDTINVTTLNIDNMGNILNNVTIVDSRIINTTIGEGGPNIGIFTKLTANDFYLYGSDLNHYVSWDSNTNVFDIHGTLKAYGCSYFDNIEICENTISSTNANGHINLIPNSAGNINISSGGVNTNIHSGNFNSIISGGGFLVNASGNVNISSGGFINNIRSGNFNSIISGGGFLVNASYVSIGSLVSDVDITTINGDLNLSTDINNNQKQIGSITLTDTDIIGVNTYDLLSLLPHNLKQGDEIKIADVDPSFDGEYVVNYIDSNNVSFTTENTLINITNGSLGTYQRINNNNINLNAGKYINIPQNIHVNFGDENTYIVKNSDNNLVIKNNTDLIIDNTDTVRINSTNVKMNDPILTLADYTLATNDNLDRGIEFKFLNTSSSFLQTLGWFGYKNDLNAFTFITNATNDNEIITGDMGNFAVGNLNINGELIFNGNLNLGCGDIINVSKLIGCNNVLTLEGNNIINMTSSNINLNAVNKINIPLNVSLNFGSVGNIVSSLINLDISSQDMMTFFSSSGNININTLHGDICLYPTLGNIRIPTEVSLIFSTNNTVNSIKCSDGELIISGSDINNLNIEQFSRINLDASEYVSIQDDVKLLFGDNLKYIYSSLDKLYFNNTIGTILINSNICELNSTDSLVINTFTTTINSNDVYISCANYVIGGNDNSVISTTFINTTFLHITDPIINIAFSNNTIEDKGIQYNYNTDDSGWFGVKTSTNRFTYYKSATNSSNIITGDLGDLDINTIYANGLYLNGDLDLMCHSLLNTKTISACSDDNLITITSNTILLSALESVSIPNTTLLTFGTNGNQLYSDTNGNLNVNSNNTVIINGNLQVNGTSLNVYSTITNIQDPIISIGGVVGPIVNDAKDRGVEFKWFSNGVSKTGFFGYQSRSERFVFIPDGTNIYEVFYGTYGNVQFGDGYFYNLDVNLGGNISGVNNIYGNSVSNLLTISSGSIHLDGNSIIPYDKFMYIGSTVNSIYSSSISSGAIQLSGDVKINDNLNYSVERFVLSSLLQYNNPSLHTMVTFVSVNGVSLDTSGTLGNSNVSDGQIKTILCSEMGNNCTYTVYVGSGKLIAPNAGNNIDASILRFNRAGQSIQLIFDAVLSAWLVVGRGCAIY